MGKESRPERGKNRKKEKSVGKEQLQFGLSRTEPAKKNIEKIKINKKVRRARKRERKEEKS